MLIDNNLIFYKDKKSLNDRFLSFLNSNDLINSLHFDCDTIFVLDNNNNFVKSQNNDFIDINKIDNNDCNSNNNNQIDCRNKVEFSSKVMDYPNCVIEDDNSNCSSNNPINNLSTDKNQAKPTTIDTITKNKLILPITTKSNNIANLKINRDYENFSTNGPFGILYAESSAYSAAVSRGISDGTINKNDLNKSKFKSVKSMITSTSDIVVDSNSCTHNTTHSNLDNKLPVDVTCIPDLDLLNSLDSSSHVDLTFSIDNGNIVSLRSSELSNTTDKSNSSFGAVLSFSEIVKKKKVFNEKPINSVSNISFGFNSNRTVEQMVKSNFSAPKTLIKNKFNSNLIENNLNLIKDLVDDKNKSIENNYKIRNGDKIQKYKIAVCESENVAPDNLPQTDDIFKHFGDLNTDDNISGRTIKFRAAEADLFIELIEDKNKNKNDGGKTPKVNNNKIKNKKKKSKSILNLNLNSSVNLLDDGVDIELVDLLPTPMAPNASDIFKQKSIGKSRMKNHQSIDIDASDEDQENYLPKLVTKFEESSDDEQINASNDAAFKLSDSKNLIIKINPSIPFVCCEICKSHIDSNISTINEHCRSVHQLKWKKSKTFWICSCGHKSKSRMVTESHMTICFDLIRDSIRQSEEPVSLHSEEVMIFPGNPLSGGAINFKTPNRKPIVSIIGAPLKDTEKKMSNPFDESQHYIDLSETSDIENIDELKSVELKEYNECNVTTANPIILETDKGLELNFYLPEPAEYKCSICKDRVPYKCLKSVKSQFTKHLQRVHKPKSILEIWNCSCKMVFYKVNDIRRHVKSCVVNLRLEAEQLNNENNLNNTPTNLHPKINLSSNTNSNVDIDADNISNPIPRKTSCLNNYNSDIGNKDAKNISSNLSTPIRKTKIEISSIRFNESYLKEGNAGEFLSDITIEAFIRQSCGIDNRKTLFINPHLANAVIDENLSFVNCFLQNVDFEHWQHIIWPIHINGNHWILYVADKLKEDAYILNSLWSENTDYELAIGYKLTSFIERSSNPINPLCLTFVLNLNCPQQNNSFDCGVFVCSFAKQFLKIDDDMKFTLPDRILMRRQIKDMITINIKNEKDKSTVNKNDKINNNIDNDTKKPKIYVQTPKKYDARVLEQINNLHNSEFDINSCIDGMCKISAALNEDVNKENNAPNCTTLPSKSIEDRALQNLFDKSSKKAIDNILHPPSTVSTPKLGDLNTYFKNKNCIAPIIDWTYEIYFPFEEDLYSFDPISIGEVKSELRKSDSAAGMDGLKYSDWRRIDPEGLFLHALFNRVMNTKLVPKSWKLFTTTLIIKPGKENNSNNLDSWRPIANLNTSYKMFANIIMQRMMHVCNYGNLINPFQKSVGNFEGCVEHNFVLQSVIENFNRTKKMATSLHFCWLDLADAFGSLPHDFIWGTLNKMGFHADTISIIKSLYADCSSIYKLQHIETSPIKITRGVRQGCPLSMLLFNICIDFLLRQCDDNRVDPVILHGKQLTVMAYADDIILMSASNIGLKTVLAKAVECAEWAHLTFRPEKCGYMRTDGINETVSINNIEIPLIKEGDNYTYLGVPIGMKISQSPREDLTACLEDFQKIVQSGLTPWQKLRAYKVFIHSRLIFYFRTREIEKQCLSSPQQTQAIGLPKSKGYDQNLMDILRELFNFPIDSNKAYFFAHLQLGGAGVTNAADEYAIQSIAQAFRMLCCDDNNVKEIAWNELFATVNLRKSNDTELCDATCIDWLNGGKSEKFACSTWWVKVRSAIRHFETLDIKIKFLISSKHDLLLTYQEKENGGQTVITKDQKKTICFLLHKAMQVAYWNQWRKYETQGRVAMALSKSKRSNVLMNFGNIAFCDWKFVVKARNYLLPLNGRATNRTPIKSCRKCGYELESQAHVLNHCNMVKVTRRHNAILDELVKVVRNDRFKIYIDSVIPGVDSMDRPDLQIHDAETKAIYLIDIKTPYDEWDYMVDARLKNEEKYIPLAVMTRDAMKNQWFVFVDTIVVGALGSWDPKNERVLLSIGLSQKDINKIATNMIRASIHCSRNIYVEHVGGITQTY